MSDFDRADSIEFARKELSDLVKSENAAAELLGFPSILRVKFIGFSSGNETKWLNLSREELIALLQG